MVTDEELAAAEAVLMVVDAPVTAEELTRSLGLSLARVDEVLHTLRADFDGEAGGRRRGFELRRAGGGWRIAARAEHAEEVSQYVLDGATVRLSQAALETLAVIAYRQPVSRARVAAIRGVSVDGVVKTLLTRGFIEQAGTDTETGASLFGTTPAFLERLGLDGLEELPALSPLLPGVENLDDVIGDE